MSPAIINKTVSSRASVLGEVTEFCTQNGVDSTALVDGICEVVFGLSALREEGESYFPAVYLTKQIGQLTSMLPSGSRVELGKGPTNSNTILQALKRAAPLATGGWSIYLQWSGNDLQYGLFRAGHVPLALTARDLLLSDGEPTGLVAVESPAPSTTLLRSGRGDRIEFRFHGARDATISPEEGIQQFLRAATSGVPLTERESVRTYGEKIIGDAIRHSHGTMMAVLKGRRRRVPAQLKDAVVLAEPLELYPAVAEFRRRQDVQAMGELESKGILLSGMIQSDGITVLRSDFSVVAFRAFVRLPRPTQSVADGGGARSRAYQSLRSLVGKGLAGVLFRSQDGRTEYAGGHHE